MAKRLSESTRVWIEQLAIEKVKNGVDPTEPLTELQRKCYESEVKNLQMYMDMVGPEQFAKTEFDISYDYCDPEDYGDDEFE